MNSWMSTVLSACAPPFRMLRSGTGRSSPSPRDRKSGSPAASAAAAATAIETARRAFAPSLDLSRVPSSSMRRASSAPWSATSMPATAGAIPVRTLSIARSTPTPWKRDLSPSRSSSASCSPVDAPDGTIARPHASSSVWHSTSTVGRARESRTSRATSRAILDKGGAPRSRWNRSRGVRGCHERCRVRMGGEILPGGLPRRNSAHRK